MRSLLLVFVFTFFIGSNLVFAQGNGTCAKFTDGNFWLSAGTVFQFNTFSVEMWVYKGSWSVTSTEAIISCTQAAGFNISIEENGSDDRIAFAYRNTANDGYLVIYYPISGMSPGWHNIAVTHDDSDADLYVDGINVDGAGSTITYNSGTHLIIGAEASSGSTPAGSYFDGYIDEVRMWYNSKLTAEKLNEWRHKVITASDAPSNVNFLFAYYKLDEDWGAGWLDDASNNVGGYSFENDLINGGSGTTSGSYAAFADFPTGFKNDAEALWGKNGANWSNASSGLTLKANTPASFVANMFCVFANNGLAGTTISDCSGDIKERAETIWFMYNQYSGISQTINLQFDLSVFGADNIDGASASAYLLLKRSGTSGDFTVAATATSVSGGLVTFENYTTTGDEYYTLGINRFTGIAIKQSYDGANSVHAADLDGDGDLDVLGTAKDTSLISWWENDGNEIFTEHTIQSGYREAHFVTTGDLDSDGDLDVLGTGSVYEISWWENDGTPADGMPKHTVSSLEYFNVGEVFVADINGDGYMDVVGAATTDGVICWWENDGTQNFSKHVVTNTFQQAISVYACDINQDGLTDIVGAAKYDNEISWWKNNGDETFTEYIIKTGYNTASSVCATDMDGDGDIDILGAAASLSSIDWWQNDGSENFAKHSVATTFFVNVKSVCAMDVDGDGDVDVLGASDGTDAIAWFENDGSQNFTEHTIDGNFDNAVSVFPADIDEDGDIDVLGASDVVDEIAYWLNNGTPVKTASYTYGNSFEPDVYKGNPDQAIGRFYLNAANEFSLNRVEIYLDGEHAGLSNFKLWQSADETFNSTSDTRLGEIFTWDPGNAGIVTFDRGFNSVLNASGHYYFITCDVTTTATGTVMPRLYNNSSLGFSGGTVNGVIDFSKLAAYLTTLPVELTSFTAKVNQNIVELNWQTATEVYNYGFEIQRSAYSSQQSAFSGQLSEWETVGFVQGHGNSNSPKSYTFVDKNPINDTLQYRLKQIDNDGAFEYSAVVEVEINNLPTEFSLEQNYPNPFNPITTIEYSVPEAGIVNISVYNLLGEKVKEIVNSYKSAGVYKINFNPIHLSSGVYIYKMTAGSFTAVKKLNLIK